MEARTERNALKGLGEAAWILIGEWFDQRRIDEGEDGHAGADTEGENQKCGRREPGVLAHLPQSEAHVLQNCLGAESNLFLGLFAQARGVAKLAFGGEVGFVCR